MQTTPQDIGATLLRLAMGVMFLAHGLVKVMVFTLPGTVGFFESLGLPGFLAYVYKRYGEVFVFRGRFYQGLQGLFEAKIGQHAG